MFDKWLALSFAGRVSARLNVVTPLSGYVSGYANVWNILSR